MKKNGIFILIKIFLIISLSSYTWKVYHLTNEKFQNCKLISNILLKHYDEISGDKGMLESKVLSKHLLHKIDSLSDSVDFDNVKNFLNSKDVVSVLIRNGGCVRIKFQRRNPLLFTWQGYYLIFHTANSTKYGCPEKNPVTCRLMPCNVKGTNSCNGQESITRIDSIENQWIFVTTRGYIGPPS